MTKVKGADLKAMRALLRARGEKFEADFIAALPLELAHLYQTSLPASWNPIDLQCSLYMEAAQALFPTEASPLRKLGFELANVTFGTLYKIMLSIPSPAFILGRVAQIWGLFYDAGKTTLEELEENETELNVIMSVYGMPDYPPPMAEVTAGYITLICQTAGGTEIRVEIIEHSSQVCKWRIHMRKK
jgi:hypothetical protein